MHVLFLDDEATQRKVVSKVLLHEGMRVTAVSTSEQAKTLVLDQSQEFDVLVLDITLPTNPDGGIDLMHDFRQCDIKTPVIFYTSRDFDSIRGKLKDGVNCLTHVQKGSFKVLIEKLHDIQHLISNTGRIKLNTLQELAEKVQTSFQNGEKRYKQLTNDVNSI